MEFFHDQEFLEDGRTIEGISIGIVARDGQTYYAEFADTLLDDAKMARLREHGWLMANVVPHLSPAAQNAVHGRLEAGQLVAHPVVKPTWKIKLEIERLISSYGDDRDQHELWTWYGAYDHVMLAQLWGPMIQLPSCVPMYTNDLKAFVDQWRRWTGQTVQLPSKPDREHDAMADARWNLDAWRAWMKAVDARI